MFSIAATVRKLWNRFARTAPLAGAHADDCGGPTYLSVEHVRRVAFLTGRRIPTSREAGALVGTTTGDLGCFWCESGLVHDRDQHAELVSRRIRAKAFAAQLAAGRDPHPTRWADVPF